MQHFVSEGMFAYNSILTMLPGHSDNGSVEGSTANKVGNMSMRVGRASVFSSDPKSPVTGQKSMDRPGEGFMRGWAQEWKAQQHMYTLWRHLLYAILLCPAPSKSTNARQLVCEMACMLPLALPSHLYMHAV